jgi:hypothetical protein
MTRNAIYLSGWEYNRILNDDAIASKQSALPAEVFWNGSAQFWLFEHVYCTKESLEGEIAAAETLGWATGSVFQDLEKRGFLKVFDWKELKEKSPMQHQRLLDVHKALQSQYDEAAILNLLTLGKEAKIEEIKLTLLKPIFDYLKCVSNISPNSLRQWIAPDQQCGVPSSPTSEALRRIAEPLTAQMKPIRAGMKLCNTPGTGVPEEARLAQKRVEERVQRPMIPDLLSGRLSQQDYHEALVPTAEFYVPINKQILQDYWENIGKLESIRDLAKEHLWKDLHGDWIPRLEQEGQSFQSEFNRLLNVALLRTDFPSYLEQVTNIAFVVAPIAAGSATGTLASLGGLDPSSAATAAALVTGATTSALDGIKNITRKSDQLTLFYQRALRSLKTKK